MALDKILERYVEKIQYHLKDCPSNLISLKVLYPSNTKQSALQPLLVLDTSIDKAYYETNLEKVFVGDDEHSLSFSKYKEYIKLETLENTTDSPSLKNTFKYYVADIPIVLNDDTIAKYKEIDITATWLRWKDTILSQFRHGKSTLWSYVVLPRFINGEDRQFIASAFLIFSKELCDDKGIMINKYCQDLLIECITYHFYSELLFQATRAAISQVMARNTSHNIGAHVMNKLVGKLRNLGFLSFNYSMDNYQTTIDLKSIHSQRIDELAKNLWYTNLPHESEIKAKILQNEILLEQIAFFNNYVKCRMDYLADISFGTPLMQANKYAYADLFKELDKVRLLLEHISGLGENFIYEINFKYIGNPMSDKNDLPIAIPNDILGMQAFYNILENIIRNTAKHAKQKSTKTTFTVNFIDEIEYVDQAYTTNSKRKQEIGNILKDYIVVEVYDNIPVQGVGRQRTIAEKLEYKRVMDSEPPDNFDSEVDALVFSQNSRINKDILEDNQLRSSALGVIEMDASAAYLRKRDVAHINHDNYNIRYNNSWSAKSVKALINASERGADCRNFLKAFKTEKKIEAEIEDSTHQNGKRTIQGHALGYRFFLLRPEVVLVVTNIQLNTDKVNELKKQGVWIVKPDVFEKHLKDGKVYNHEFVLIDEDAKLSKVKAELQISSEGEVDLTTYYKTSLPLRILEIKTTELKNTDAETEEHKGLIDKISDDDKKAWLQMFEGFCWKKWEKNNYLQKLNIRKSYNPDNESETQAVFLDHLYSDGTNELPAQIWGKNIGAFYIEALSSIAQSKLPDFTKLTQKTTDSKKKIQEYLEELNYKSIVTLEKNLTTYRKLKESVLSKVIVVDERIQYASENNDFMDIKFCDLYAKMNIIIPGEVNLSNNSFSQTVIGTIEQFIKSEKSRAKETDHILIHYSILERMYKENEINDKLRELIGDSSINIVITSGRGVPENLSNGFRFVNLSSVITAFIDHRSKYSINYLLNSSRKPGKK